MTTAEEVPELPIKECNKRGLVVRVRSEVLKASIIFAPTASLSGEKLAVFSWREAYILAKANPGNEMLLALHQLKLQIPGTVIEGISISEGKPKAKFKRPI